jgi:hypothetical protein
VFRQGNLLLRVFRRMDLDHDGVISPAEFEYCVGPSMFNMALSSDEAQELWRACDLRNTGEIPYEQFHAVLSPREVDMGYDPLGQSQGRHLHHLKSTLDMEEVREGERRALSVCHMVCRLSWSVRLSVYCVSGTSLPSSTRSTHPAARLTSCTHSRTLPHTVF